MNKIITRSIFCLSLSIVLMLPSHMAEKKDMEKNFPYQINIEGFFPPPPNNFSTDIPITGGEIGEKYSCTVDSPIHETPCGQNLIKGIEFSWDDGTPHVFKVATSGEKGITASHIWWKENSYVIKARTIVKNDLVSDWITLERSMPKKYEYFFNTHLEVIFVYLIQQICGLKIAA